MQTPWRSLHEPARRLVSVWLPTGVLCLIGVNFTLFLAQYCLGLGTNKLEHWGELSWAGLKENWLWQPLTCLFLHRSLLSLAAGAWLLWIGGRRLEAIVGRRHVVALYLTGGAAAALGQITVNWLGHLHDGQIISPCMGSMAAALALFVAYACIMPETAVAAPWSIPLRLKAKHLALSAATISAGLMIWDFYFGHIEQPAAAWLIGSTVGCLYSWQLGFGQRIRANAEAPCPGKTTVTLMHAPPLEMDHNPRQRQAPATAIKTSPLTASAAIGETRFTESERRMSAREYIAERIDPILDKISLHGIGSLTEEERAVLEKGREKISQTR